MRFANGLANPNELQAYSIFQEDDPYSGAPLCTDSADGKAMVSLETKGTMLFTTIRMLLQFELNNCCHICVTSKWEWNTSKICSLPVCWSILDDWDQHVSTVKARLPPAMTTSALEDVPTPNTFAMTKHWSTVTLQEMADHWCIGLDQVHPLLKHATRNLVHLLQGRLCVPTPRKIQGEWFTDTVEGWEQVWTNFCK